jgi:hypothetical protein
MCLDRDVAHSTSEPRLEVQRASRGISDEAEDVRLVETATHLSEPDLVLVRAQRLAQSLLESENQCARAVS